MPASWLDRRPPSLFPRWLMPPALAVAAGLPFLRNTADLAAHLHGTLAAVGSGLGAGSRALAGNRIIDTAALPCVAPEMVAAVQRAGARILAARIDADAVVAAVALVVGVLIVCVLTKGRAAPQRGGCHTLARLPVSESGAANRRATTRIPLPGTSWRPRCAGKGAHPWA